MAQAAHAADNLARARARNLLVRDIRERLRGQRLDIRERDHDLVISFPGNPEKGLSVHIVLATGEVSLKRTVWDFLGHLPGYGSGDPDQLLVDTDKIAAMLIRPDDGPESGGNSR